MRSDFFHFGSVIVAGVVTMSSLLGGCVYWTDRGASQLKRMRFDGSDVQVLALTGDVATPGTNVRGIAVDVVGNQVFWADNGADRILRAALDGTGSRVVVQITGGNSFPADLRLDRVAGHIYWCDQTRNRIQRSALDGTELLDLIVDAAASGPYFLDLDPIARKLYWGDFSAGAIFRSDLDGSHRETLLTGNNQTRGVKVDPEGGMLYWINRDDKKVHRCPLSAFAKGTLTLADSAVQTLYAGLDTPHGLAIDVVARKIYWADTGTNTGSGQGERAVSRGDFDGHSPQEILATGSEPWDVDLDLRCASYAEWRARFFRRDASPTDTAPLADPDGDRQVNIAEYAFGTSPTVAEKSESSVSGFLLPDGAGTGFHPALRYIRRTGSGDLSYSVELSADLVRWEELAAPEALVVVSRRALGDDREEVVVRTSGQVPEAGQRYLRVAVRLTP